MSTTLPVPAAPAKNKPFRIKPDLQERLRQARLLILMKLGYETEENDIFDQFMRDKFDPWLTDVLAGAPPQQPAETGEEGGGW